MLNLLEAGKDDEQWLSLWDRTGREPFAHPAYGISLAAPGERAIALGVETSAGAGLIPLVLRPVPETALWDACSPYGYGGPYVCGDLTAAALIQGVCDWARGAGLASVFLRLSLDVDIDGLARADMAPEVISENVVVDLSRDQEATWRQYEHKVRKNVGTAERAGCVARRHAGTERLDSFVEVYTETMRRRDAGGRLMYERTVFERLLTELSGGASLFTVEDAHGRVISVELVLESERQLYSFLGGTLEEAFALRPNDLLKHAVITYGRETGRSRYVLGGGFLPGDGIFRYKRSFDRSGVVPYRVARITPNGRVYENLVRAHEAANGEASEYFPRYRAPVGVKPGSGAVERDRP